MCQIMLKRQAMKKLLIVDDDEILQNFLYKYFASKSYNPECLLDGSRLPVILDKGGADLIVLDVEMPHKDGFYWLKWLQQYHAHIPVIMASVRSSEHERLFGLEHGARDYLVKPFQCKELLIRVENVLGSASLQKNGKYIRIGELKLDTQTHTVNKRGEEIKLTLMEATILKLLYLNGGAPVSRDEIMAQIRGGVHNLLDRSIDIHINKLRKKIEDDPTMPVYICTVRGKGYCLHYPKLE